MDFSMPKFGMRVFLDECLYVILTGNIVESSDEQAKSEVTSCDVTRM